MNLSIAWPIIAAVCGAALLVLWSRYARMPDATFTSRIAWRGIDPAGIFPAMGNIASAQVLPVFSVAFCFVFCWT